MRLTQAQIDLLKKWHRIDTRAGSRVCHEPYALQWGTCRALEKRGLLRPIRSVPRGVVVTTYMLTDAGVAAATGGDL